MKNKRLLLGFGSIIIISALLLLLRQSAIVELVILHTNDHHGYCWSVDNKGGLAKQLTIVKKIRNQNKNVLVLSGGDINTGYPEADIHEGEPSFRGMKLLGFDAMAVGNHEFDVSLETLRKQESWGGFPFLAANIYDKKTGQRVFKPYVIKTIGTLRVALLGLTTEETVQIAKFVDGLEFRDPIEEAKKVMPELEKDSDLIIALTHLGVTSERHTPIRGITDYRLAAENPRIQVIVGGHSHTLLREPLKEGRTLILQAYQYAKNLGELRIKFNTLSKRIVKHTYHMHDLNEEIPEDNEMITHLNPYLEKAKAIFDQPVGENLVALNGEREEVRSRETNLGNLITDLSRQITKAHVAIQNGGGIRSSIPKGRVTYRDIRKAFPFQNTIVVVQLKGEELLEVINRAASLSRPAGGFLQVSGISFAIEKDHVKNVKVNGEPLVLEKVYSVATNDFVAGGGDGYEVLKNKPRVDTGYLLFGALKDYFEKQKRISARIEGRIVVR